MGLKIRKASSHLICYVCHQELSIKLPHRFFWFVLRLGGFSRRKKLRQKSRTMSLTEQLLRRRQGRQVRVRPDLSEVWHQVLWQAFTTAGKGSLRQSNSHAADKGALPVTTDNSHPSTRHPSLRTQKPSVLRIEEQAELREQWKSGFLLTKRGYLVSRDLLSEGQVYWKAGFCSTEFRLALGDQRAKWV